jgi:hypothetical protein
VVRHRRARLVGGSRPAEGSAAHGHLRGRRRAPHRRHHRPDREGRRPPRRPLGLPWTSPRHPGALSFRAAPRRPPPPGLARRGPLRQRRLVAQRPGSAMVRARSLAPGQGIAPRSPAACVRCRLVPRSRSHLPPAAVRQPRRLRPRLDPGGPALRSLGSAHEDPGSLGPGHSGGGDAPRGPRPSAQAGISSFGDAAAAATALTALATQPQLRASLVAAGHESLARENAPRSVASDWSCLAIAPSA